METTDKQKEEEQIISQAEQPQEETVEKENSKMVRHFYEYFAKSGGVMVAICMAVMGLAIGYGIVMLLAALFTCGYNLCANGYNRWFGELDGQEIGRNGLVYVYQNDAIMKTCPNRIVMSHIESIEQENGDTIGIVKQYGKYGILNLNSATFILPAEYDNIWSISDSTYIAILMDSVYTVLMPTAEIIKQEPANIINDVRPIYLNNDDYYSNSINENDILLYEYTDCTGMKGLMSKDLKKLTPAIYTEIKAIK